jgi:biotin-(acetyl-CoA carboxylase) ligase
MTSERYLKIIKKDALASTNDYAALLAKQGSPEITVVRANSQTKGRGRRGAALGIA